MRGQGSEELQIACGSESKKGCSAKCQQVFQVNHSFKAFMIGTRLMLFRISRCKGMTRYDKI